MTDIFNLLTPEIYNGLYSQKSYSQEHNFIRHYSNTLSSESGIPLQRCVEFGAGTGNLTCLLIESFRSYLAVEPSKSFCNYLNDRFSLYKDRFITLNSTLEDCLDQLRTDLECPTLYVANFNVVNYLNQSLFTSVLDELSSVASPGSIFIFDTWSLDYVRRMPLVMNSCEDFYVPASGQGTKHDVRVMERTSQSVFDPSLASLSIRFNFNEISHEDQTRLAKGSETHTIFPLDLHPFIASIASTKWKTMDISPYSDIEDGTLKCLDLDATDFSTRRNWYFVLSI